jgi:hypothetical protein
MRILREARCGALQDVKRGHGTASFDETLSLEAPDNRILVSCLAKPVRQRVKQIELATLAQFKRNAEAFVEAALAFFQRIDQCAGRFTEFLPVSYRQWHLIPSMVKRSVFQIH